MNIKKIIVIVITAISVLSLTACGKDEQPIINNSGAGNEQSNANGSVLFGDNSTPDTLDEEPPKELGIWDVLPEIPVTEESAFTYSYNNDLGGMVITDYLKESPKVRIPDTIEGEPVVAVDFSNLKKELTELILPDSVNDFELSYTVRQTLQYVNFISGLSGLVGVYIPNGTEEIPQTAFSGCGNLSDIYIPSSVTSIGYSAFYSCTSLTSIDIPGSVSEIADSAFNECKNLTSVTLHDGLKKVGAAVFRGCTSLSNIDLPNSVTEIGNGAFLGCQSLTSITIPSGVMKISESAFNTTGLTSVEIPYGVTEIGGYAFANCTNLTSVEIPDSVTVFGAAFVNCTSLTSIDIPASVTNFDLGAFYDCTSLDSITVPDGVTKIWYGGKSYFEYSMFPENLTVIHKGISYTRDNINDLHIIIWNP